MNIFDITASSLLTKLSKAIFKGTPKIKILFLSALILIISAILFATLVDSKVLPQIFGAVSGILGGLGGLCILGIYSYQVNVDESEAEAALKKVEDRAKAHPNEPTAAWDLARIKLENYLNRNLSQIQWIFIWTVLIMIAGFIIIGYGVLKAYEASDNIDASILTTSSGILLEFIGATFLIIYKSTMRQAKDYVNVLERINAVGMSVQILDSINKDEKLQDQTRADIAKQLLTLYSVK